MQRLTSKPRSDWQARVEAAGLTYHTLDNVPYWDESAFYQLTSREVDTLESAANQMHQLCIAAAQHVIDNDLFARFGIPDKAVPLIKNSWDRDDFSLYGRFDFAWDGHNPPKLLEYNADTPTSLVEAAVAQWFWLRDCHPDCDQFNSIHERLIAAWKRFAQTTGTRHVHLGGDRDYPEDQQTILYIEDTCHQAGMPHTNLPIQDVGLDRQTNTFVDLNCQPIECCFKLYPWEWIWGQGDQTDGLFSQSTRFLEPMWKMLLSNKALLPVLWELNPGHPNLLPAYESPTEIKSGEAPDGYVLKPKLSREGANIRVVCVGRVVEHTGGEYDESQSICQARHPMPQFDGNHPVMGVWIVDHECAGLGIREDKSAITGNTSRFIPHLL